MRPFPSSPSRTVSPAARGHVCSLRGRRGAILSSYPPLVSSTADVQAVRAFESVAVGLPAGLDIRWLGVSGYCLTYEGESLFIDPYVSRVPLRSLLLRRKALPDRAMLDGYGRAPGRVVGVLVGHTHFDHAVDAPAIAARHRVPAYGSDSLARLMALHGVGETRSRAFVPGVVCTEPSGRTMGVSTSPSTGGKGHPSIARTSRRRVREGNTCQACSASSRARP